MLGNHKNAVLQFSGGKDSTALIHLARPWLDRITVLFAETGATFPHLLKHIHATCEKLNATLVIVKPPAITTVRASPRRAPTVSSATAAAAATSALTPTP